MSLFTSGSDFSIFCTTFATQNQTVQREDLGFRAVYELIRLSRVTKVIRQTMAHEKDHNCQMHSCLFLLVDALVTREKHFHVN